MYKVCGFTNYECTCGEEQVFGKELNFDEAISLFVKLTQNINSLDFAGLDEMIDEWAVEFDWNEDDYYSGSYGGCIMVYDQACEPELFDREILLVRVERDPIKKVNIYSDIEFGEEIAETEKDRYLFLNKMSVG